METDAEYRSDARWGVMGYSWNVNDVGSHDTHAEVWELEEANAIRRFNSHSKVMVTREVNVIGSWYDSINITDPRLVEEHWFIMCPAPGNAGLLVPCASKWGDNSFSPPRITLGRWLNWSNPAASSWWVDTFIGGALRRPEIDGVFVDTGPGAPVDSHVLSTDGTACAKVSADAQAAFDRAAVLAHSLGKFLTTQGAVLGGATVAPWQTTGTYPMMCSGGGLAGCTDTAPITAESCAVASREMLADARFLADTGHTFQLFMQGGVWKDFKSPRTLDNVTVNSAAFDALISLFQIARGRSALLQWHDWSFTETKRFIWSPALELDYGVPVAAGAEVSTGVFQRRWTNRLVTLNCSEFVAQLKREQPPQ
jgi:hypothetical protein